MLCGIQSLSPLLHPLLWTEFASRERDVKSVGNGRRVPLVGLHGSIISSRWCLRG